MSKMLKKENVTERKCMLKSFYLNGHNSLLPYEILKASKEGEMAVLNSVYSQVEKD